MTTSASFAHSDVVLGIQSVAQRNCAAVDMPRELLWPMWPLPSLGQVLPGPSTSART